MRCGASRFASGAGRSRGCAAGRCGDRCRRRCGCRSSVGEPLGRQHVLGEAVGDDPPRVQQDDPVGDGGGLVEVVQDGADGGAVLVRQVPDEVEEFDLVPEVEVGGRLVEEQQPGVLGEAAREPHPLELASGEVLGAPFGQVGEARQGQRARSTATRPSGSALPQRPRYG